MKRIKIDSYDVARQKQYKKQQEELKQLLHNGASEDKSSSNVYSSRQQYDYERELNRLQEIRHSYNISGNKSKLEEVDKQIELHKRTYINKNRKDILIKIKDNIILLFNSFIHQKEQTR